MVNALKLSVIKNICEISTVKAVSDVSAVRTQLAGRKTIINRARLFGVDLGAFISISARVLQLWFLAMGIALIRWK